MSTFCAVTSVVSIGTIVMGTNQHHANENELKLPWQVIHSRSTAGAPAIVDCDLKPICSFGNQMRHRGPDFVWKIARKIVERMNRKTGRFVDLRQAEKKNG